MKNQKKSKKFLKKENSGITLIALVISVIVLLILSGISISMISGENGILKQAGNARTQTDIAGEKEILQTSALAAISKEKYGDLTKEKLDDELNKYSEIQSTEQVDNGIVVTFKSNRVYIVNFSGDVSRYYDIAIDNLVVKDGDNVLAENCKSVQLGKSLTINFEASIPGGSITSITPSILYTTSGEKSKTFTIVGKASDGQEITKEYTVNLKGYYSIPEIQVGDFVKYDVEYQDMWDNSLNYSTTNGWRLLNYKKNEDGTYSDVELISKGVPAYLDYNTNGTNANWWPNSDDEITNFKKILNDNNTNTYLFYTGRTIYCGIQSAAGMYYNLGEIIFRYGTSRTNYNQGYYRYIKNADKTYSNTDNNSENEITPTGNDLFKVGNTKIRMLTLSEINKALNRKEDDSKYDVDNTSVILKTEDPIGLYCLEDYYSPNVDYKYWIASPKPTTNNDYFSSDRLNLCSITMFGKIDSMCNNSRGIRPVITVLSPKVSFEISDDGKYFTIE